MSFISKLFRKTENDDDSADEHAPAPEPAPGADDAASAAAAHAAASPPDAEHEAAPAASATGGEAEAEWWENSAPIPGDAGAPPAAPAAEDSQPPARTDTAPPAATNPGTRPLEEPAAAPAELSDDTRPLTKHDQPMITALHSQRGLAFAALRDIGRVRSINQDSIFGMLSTLPRESNDLPFGVFVVADGMGGHQGGEIASRLAISTVVQHILAELVVPTLADSSTEALQPLLIEAVQTANRSIWEQAQMLGSDMGTTCTVALMLGHALYLGHVGDSRAYLATPTGLRLLTNDHSTVGRLIQVGQLDASEAREHPLRSQLYRTVGQQPEVLVDFSYQQLGDATHLLLASDGLWGLLDDDILLDVIQHHPWPHDACNELIARANLAGGDDNISAIVVSLPAHNA